MADEKIIQLQVSMNLEDGQVLVRGPIHLKPVCIKALATAMNIILDYKAPAVAITPVRQNGEIIKPPTMQ